MEVQLGTVQSTCGNLVTLPRYGWPIMETFVVEVWIYSTLIVPFARFKDATSLLFSDWRLDRPH